MPTSPMSRTSSRTFSAGPARQVPVPVLVPVLAGRLAARLAGRASARAGRIGAIISRSISSTRRAGRRGASPCLAGGPPAGGAGGGLGGGATLDVTIPPGVQDGTVLRLKGKGAPGTGGGPAGDALVELAVRPHRRFRRDGDDIVLEVPVTLDEAALGARIEVPTIGGRVQMTVPKGASSGDVLRLKGRGIKGKSGTGDQRVVLQVAMPERIDAELEQFLKGWGETHRYDPRAALRRET